MEKTHLLLRILAVIGRFGPHLTIVMIFVTQNNFKNGPGISDRLLGFYPDRMRIGSGMFTGELLRKRTGQGLEQTPSTGLRHPSFNHCRI